MITVPASADRKSEKRVMKDPKANKIEKRLENRERDFLKTIGRFTTISGAFDQLFFIIII